MLCMFLLVSFYFCSSVQLLGDLLFKVSGVSGKMTTDTAHEDDNFGTEHSQKVLYFVHVSIMDRNQFFCVCIYIYNYMYIM